MALTASLTKYLQREVRFFASSSLRIVSETNPVLGERIVSWSEVELETSPPQYTTHIWLLNVLIALSAGLDFLPDWRRSSALTSR